MQLLQVLCCVLWIIPLKSANEWSRFGKVMVSIHRNFFGLMSRRGDL